MNYPQRSLSFSYYLIVIVAFGVLLFATGANAASVSWDGGGDGSTWESANNWSGNAVPDTADDVTIDANTVVTLAGTDTVASLTLGNVGGTTSPELQFNYNAINVGGSAAPFVVSGNVIMYSGSSISHADNVDGDDDGDSDAVFTLNLDINGDLTLNSGATIEADSAGCPVDAQNDGFAPSAANLCQRGANTGFGNGASGSGTKVGAGGGHGGIGGDSDTDVGSLTGGDPYGSYLDPKFLGASGGAADSSAGGKGGGAIWIDVAGTFTLDGSISATGGDGVGSGGTENAGGGAGGSVKIVTVTLDGSGSIVVDGGAGGGDDSDVDNHGFSGGGSAGRAYVEYSDSASAFVVSSSTVTASGGRCNAYTGAGTCYDGSDDGEYGSTYIYDSTADALSISEGLNLDDTLVSVGSVSLLSGAILGCDPTAATPAITASGVFTISGNVECAESVTTFTLTGGTVTVADNTTHSSDGDLIFEATSTFTDIGSSGNGVSFTMNNPGDDLTFDLPTDATFTMTDITVNTSYEGIFYIIVNDGDPSTDNGRATVVVAGTSPITANVDWQELTALTLGASVTIDADELGCQSTINQNGYGPDGSNVCTITTAGYSQGTSSSGAQSTGGAGHGGGGGTPSSGSLTVGATYDSTSDPVLFGSSAGAADDTIGGAGGGIIIFNISGSFVLDGDLLADGGSTVSASGVEAPGGGSGGSINVVSGTLSCTDVSPANGVCDATPALSVDGGAGSDATDSNPGGGGGGGGIIYVEYSSETGDMVDGLVAGTNAIAGVAGTGAVAGSNGVVTVQDNVPTYVSSVYEDDDGDGIIDQVVLTFSETVTIGGTLASTRFMWVSSSGANGFAGSLSGNATVSGTDVTVVLSSAESDETGHSTIPTVAYDDNSNDGTDKIQDAGGGIVQTFSAKNVSDGADPFLVSSSPTDSATSVAVSSTVVLTFTESISTGSFTYTCCGAGTDPGRSGAWTSSDTVYTITPTTNWTNSEIITINITAAPDTSSNAFGGAGSGAADPFTFTIASNAGGGVPTPGAGHGLVVTSAQLISPNGGEVFTGGEVVTILWTASGNTLASVVVSYSLNHGKNYTVIASDEVNDGAYIWTVPNIDAPNVYVQVKAVTEDGGEIISDASNQAFSISATTEAPVPQVNDEDALPTDSKEIHATMQRTDGTMIDLYEGHLFRGEELSGVYLVRNGMRYVFPSEVVFSSYYDTFDDVIMVKDSYLKELDLGGRVTMAPGRMIKIQSDNRVFQVQSDGSISHIPDEATARALYGDTWNQQITDVPVTFWGDYPLGEALANL